MAFDSYCPPSVASQLNVQGVGETTHFRRMKAKNIALLVHLFHDLIIRSLAEVPFLLLKDDLRESPYDHARRLRVLPWP